MTTTVIKSVGTSSRDYSTFTSWYAAAPTDLTQSRANTTRSGSTSSTIELDASASASNTDYVGHAVWCDARPSEKRLITSYNGSTKTATIGSLNGSNATWDNTPSIEAFTIDPVIWKAEAYNDSEFTEGGWDFRSGHTTNAANYLWITPAAGQSFKNNGGVTTSPLRYDQSNGVGYQTSGSYAILVICDSSYVLIEGMQLKCASTSAYSATATIAGLNLTLKDCIVETTKTLGPCTNANYPPTFINCVVACTGATFDGGMSMRGGVKVYNSTFVRPSDLTASTQPCFVNESTSYPLIQNCAVFGFTTPFGGTIGSYTSCNNNASDVASGSIPGTSPQGSLTFSSQFEAVTNAARDWRPKAGGGLNTAGVRDQTHTADLDIIGAARSTSTPSIGAREYAVIAVSVARVERGRAVGRGMGRGIF